MLLISVSETDDHGDVVIISRLECVASDEPPMPWFQKLSQYFQLVRAVPHKAGIRGERDKQTARATILTCLFLVIVGITTRLFQQSFEVASR
jgi:hypothetical protein